MITKESIRESDIIESLEQIKKISEASIANVKNLIADMQNKIKPHEDFLDSIPTEQMNFYYGKSYKIRTLIDEIKELEVNS